MTYLRQSLVSHIRNAGWPTDGDAYGHRVLVVVVGVTPHQGDGNADYRAMQDRSASLCRELRGGTRNAAVEHGESEGRGECGNIVLNLKLAGELCVSETCMQGSGEGSCKSTVWQLGGCLSHCPHAVVSSIIARHKGLGYGVGCVLPVRALAWPRKRGVSSFRAI